MAHLFDPLQVRHCTLRNRVVMPPIALEQATARGEVAERHVKHYTAIAADGPGLVIVEHTYIRRDGRVSDKQLGIYDEPLIPGLARVAESIKSNGAVACLQITHCGARTTRALIGTQPLGPWTIPVPGDPESPRPLRVEELRQLEADYAAAARRARAAGFDAVEIHGAHGYLLNQFVSPVTNRRTDEYGGSVENRLRFPRQVIAAVKRAVGDEMLVLYRFGADDMTPGGLTADDAEVIAPMLADAGVDILDVSGGLGGSGRDRFSEQGYFVLLAARVRRAAGIPAIGVGNVREPEYADRVIRDGLVDLIAVGRAQIADPNWAAKARQALAGA
jgi:2,4-dienoyl-CoA reductase-like NADH-dependent reductase (Old Yellow Enzyme family)